MTKPTKPLHLFIFAHPDDESFYSGGYIAELSQTKQTPYVACLTQPQNPARVQEFYSALEALGAKGHIGPFLDGSLIEQKEAVATYVTNLIKKFTPLHLITFGDEPHYNHHDHLQTEQAVFQAWQRLKKPGYLWRRSYKKRSVEQHKDLREQRSITPSRRILHKDKLKTFQSPNLTLTISDRARAAQLKAIEGHISQHPETLLEFIRTQPQEEYYFIQT